MLLDLGRNDVGRVAEIGTVKVTDSVLPRIRAGWDAAGMWRKASLAPA